MLRFIALSKKVGGDANGIAYVIIAFIAMLAVPLAILVVSCPILICFYAIQGVILGSIAGEAMVVPMLILLFLYLFCAIFVCMGAQEHFSAFPYRKDYIIPSKEQIANEIRAKNVQKKIALITAAISSAVAIIAIMSFVLMNISPIISCIMFCTVGAGGIASIVTAVITKVKWG